MFELRVTFVGQDAIQAVSLMRKTGQEIDTSWTPEWNAVTDQRGGSFFPDSGWLRFPLKPGVTYPVEFEIRRPFRDPVAEGAIGMAPGGRNARMTTISYEARMKLNATVARWEQITVPAGTFRAMRVDGTGTFEALDTDGGGRIQFAIWYAPEVRRWVKWRLESTNLRGQPGRRDTEELLEYHLE